MQSPQSSSQQASQQNLKSFFKVVPPVPAAKVGGRLLAAPPSAQRVLFPPPSTPIDETKQLNQSIDTESNGMKRKLPETFSDDAAPQTKRSKTDDDENSEKIGDDVVNWHFYELVNKNKTPSRVSAFANFIPGKAVRSQLPTRVESVFSQLARSWAWFSPPAATQRFASLIASYVIRSNRSRTRKYAYSLAATKEAK